MSKSQRDRFKDAVEFTDAISQAMRTIGSTEKGKSGGEQDNADIEDYLLLRSNSWFRDFSPNQIDELVRSGQVLSFSAGETIVHEGEDADCFYTLLEGGVEVVKDKQVINSLNPGSCFGELGHLANTGKRIASIRAVSPARVLAVETDKLTSMSAASQAGFYKAFLTITIERLVEKNVQSASEARSS